MKKCLPPAVYEFPMTRGDMYVGETSRCATERIKEHARSMSKDLNLARHSEMYEVRNCRPQLEKARIVRVREDFYERRESETSRTYRHVQRDALYVKILKNPEATRRRDEEYDDVLDQLSRLGF